LRLGQLFQFADLSPWLLCSIQLPKRSWKAWFTHSSCNKKVLDASKMGRKSKGTIARVANFGRIQKSHWVRSPMSFDLLEKGRITINKYKNGI
jgi:hypothetical protein